MGEQERNNDLKKAEENIPKEEDFQFLPSNQGEERFISFKALEREYFEKGKEWFVIATILALISIVYFIMDGAFSSAIVFALILSFLYLYGNEPPKLAEIHITSWGVYINRSFYDYKNIQCFWIINDNTDDIHALHLEVGKNIFRILTIQLHDIEDFYIRKAFKPYIKEDLEREEPVHNRIKRIIQL